MSSVHGILQAVLLEGVVRPLLPGPDSGIEPASPVSLALAGRFFFWVGGGSGVVVP